MIYRLEDVEAFENSALRPTASQPAPVRNASLQLVLGGERRTPRTTRKGTLLICTES